MEQPQEAQVRRLFDRHHRQRAAVTPAAGFVSPIAAVIIGVRRPPRLLFRGVAGETAGLDDALDVWAFAITYGMQWIIDRITPVRVGRGQSGGLGAAPHGEEAYPHGV